ncbi:MAG: MBOAT family protein [Alphaproteobacteria bacterium]|nr:MBOAT family protein [Alphaproteobacteria bacterium]
MLFTEARFFIFFAVVFGLYWLLRPNTWRKGLLLLASNVFYGAWDPRFLALIWFSVLLDYIVGFLLAREGDDSKRKMLVWLSVAANLAVLGFFKYFNFFADSLQVLLASMGVQADWNTLHIILPVGISFYTFQSLSYTIDVYRKQIQAEKSLLNYATFVMFFPQLVAGPIVRAADFLPQLEIKQEWREVAWRSCVLLFLIGFFKKACVSDTLAPYIDHIFSTPEQYGGASVILGTILYAVQIYCDFSGYTDMAIATAGLLGYKLPLNFNAPYLATSVIDFWHRWHISLSTWLRDYLYISLGGNRLGAIKRYRNLMLTMFLGGLWHGANWTFVMWGALHGLALSLNHLVAKVTTNMNVVRSVAQIILTFAFVCFAWVFFRAENIQTAFVVLAQMGRSGAESLPVILWAVFGVLALTHILWRKIGLFDKIAHAPTAIFSLILAVFIVISALLMPMGYQPFIYFQF